MERLVVGDLVFASFIICSEGRHPSLADSLCVRGKTDLGSEMHSLCRVAAIT